MPDLPNAQSMQAADAPLLIRVLKGETAPRPPVWFMRQAGRYLPEYRALRATTPDFVSFCLNPEKAAEATLQPMRRFGFDAAIVFADILLIPKALGQEVRFEAGEGPRLGPLPSIEVMRDLAAGAGDALSSVGETLSRVRAELEPDRALIGFAGAPWTVMTYMLDGAAKEDRATARRYAYEQSETVDAVLEIMIEATAVYLAMQAKAGAQVLKIFESWAEGLPQDLMQRLVIEPHRRLVERVRELGVTVPLIGFPTRFCRLCRSLREGRACGSGGARHGMPPGTGSEGPGHQDDPGRARPLAVARRWPGSGSAGRSADGSLGTRSVGVQPGPRHPARHTDRACRTGAETDRRGMTRKLAVVLFNLGGPDGPDAVKPFLTNLFSDRPSSPCPAWSGVRSRA
jgi:uroporphyrinogen decarboxylase